MSSEELERIEAKQHLISQVLTAIVKLYESHRADEAKELYHPAKIDQLYNYLPHGLDRMLFNKDFTSYVKFATTTDFYLDDAVVGSNHLPMYADMIVNLLWSALDNYNPQACPLELVIGVYPDGRCPITITWGYSLGETVLDTLTDPITAGG